MSDIELIIKVPEEIYKASQIIDAKYEDVIQIPLEVIKNATPLDTDVIIIPKGATNGNMIEDMFPNEYKYFYDRSYSAWWNALFKMKEKNNE